MDRFRARLLWIAGGCALVLAAGLWLVRDRGGNAVAPLGVDSAAVGDSRPTSAASAPATRLETPATPTAPALEVPDAQRPALERMLAEENTAVVECLILWVSSASTAGTGSLKVLALAAAPRVRLDAGDARELRHAPAEQQQKFGASTPHAELMAGQVRDLLVRRELLGGRTLLLAGPVRRRVDFEALRSSCDWPDARPFIGRSDCSVVEAEWVDGATSRDASKDVRRPTLRVVRAWWSSAFWREGDTVKVSNAPRPVEVLGRLQALERGERGGPADYASSLIMPPELRNRRFLAVVEHMGSIHMLRMVQAR